VISRRVRECPESGFAATVCVRACVVHAKRSLRRDTPAVSSLSLSLLSSPAAPCRRKLRPNERGDGFRDAGWARETIVKSTLVDASLRNGRDYRAWRFPVREGRGPSPGRASLVPAALFLGNVRLSEASPNVRSRSGP